MQEFSSICFATWFHSCLCCQRLSLHTKEQFLWRQASSHAVWTLHPVGFSLYYPNRDIWQFSQCPLQYTAVCCKRYGSTMLWVHHSQQPCVLSANKVVERNSQSIHYLPIWVHQHRGRHSSAIHLSCSPHQVHFSHSCKYRKVIHRTSPKAWYHV